MNRGHDRRNQRQDQGGRDQNNSDQKRERPKKESILELSKFIDKQVRVKFQGGREVTGKLKGFDHLLNLVLDNCVEYLRDTDDSYKITENTRTLNLVVCRGPAITVVCPQDGHEIIQNPFISAD